MQQHFQFTVLAENRQFCPFALGDVAHGGDDQATRAMAQGTEHDINGKFASVPAAAEQFQTRAHGTSVRIVAVAMATPNMSAPESLRQENVNALAD